ALPRLSHEHREALLLVVAAGHSYEDAADICACGVNAMKQRVRRARMHLAALTDPDPPAAWPKAASDRPPDAYRPPAADPGLEGPMAAAQPPPVTLGGPALRRSGDT
ncbi:MAG: sigma factor-like helix-turn-helix DNA-binding protein, partial [Caulobacterales bacterium]